MNEMFNYLFISPYKSELAHNTVHTSIIIFNDDWCVSCSLERQLSKQCAISKQTLLV